MTREAVILSGVRTPFGRYNGILKDVRPDDLAALVMREVVERAGVDPHEIEDVILGCANQASEDNRNVARMAILLAGLPIEVGGQTVNRLCGSSLQAVNSAAQAIVFGAGDVFVAASLSVWRGKGAPARPSCCIAWRFSCILNYWRYQ
jgi:acetyl-CoA acetyltransferase